MFSVLVLNQVNVDPTDDRYGEGVNLLAGGDPDYDDLDVGSILLALSDGSIIQRAAAAGDIADSVDARPDQFMKFIVRTANGLQKGIDISVGNFAYSYNAYVAPVAQVMTVVAAAPADLAPFIGQYATITITKVSEPEYKVSRTKSYSVILNDVNSADIDLVMAELVTKINADHDLGVTVAYNAGNNTLTLTGTVGKRFNVVAEDIIRDSTIVTTTQPVVGTPTSALEKSEIERSSWDGYNLSKMASELYNLKKSTDPDVTYATFVIGTKLNIGPSKGHQFDTHQIIAVPVVCTGVIEELTSLLDYLSGADAAATWTA